MGGVSIASPMGKSVSFLRKGKRSYVDGFVIAYLSSVELLGIYIGSAVDGFVIAYLSSVELLGIYRG